jgi:hypothetical protein
MIETDNNIEDEISDREHELYLKRKELIPSEDELVELKSSLRHNTLREVFDLFMNSQSSDTRKFVYLNDSLLHDAIASYYYDIHRYKEFSGSELANAYKQAAYTIKWIAKFRPIQIREEAGELSDSLVDINLLFAISCAFMFLDEKTIDIIMKEKNEVDQRNKLAGSNKERSFYDRLLYIIRYRPLSGKQLISMFESLELACK